MSRTRHPRRPRWADVASSGHRYPRYDRWFAKHVKDDAPPPRPGERAALANENPAPAGADTAPSGDDF